MTPRRSLREIYPKRKEIPLLIVIAAACLLAGLFMPILTLKKMIWMKNSFSILSGIQSLWVEKHIGLAFIIFFFSIIFPIVKLITLWVLWFYRLADEERKKLFFWLKVLGKWSMLDVFVVAVIIVAVKFGLMAEATPQAGVYVFGGSILASMLLTMWMDAMARKHPKI